MLAFHGIYDQETGSGVEKRPSIATRLGLKPTRFRVGQDMC